MEILARETQTATQRLFAAYWTNSQRNGVISIPPEVAISASLLHLAETLDRKLTDNALKSYIAVLSELRQEEVILAFSRAVRECKGFFPSPATLLDFSGRVVTGDPIAAEAKEQLQYLLNGMRTRHGLRLQDIPGKVTRLDDPEPVYDKNGDRIIREISEPATVFPISRRTEATLVRLGWGSRNAGIALIAEHPALHRPHYDDDEQYQKSRLRASDEIVERFTAAYREA